MNARLCAENPGQEILTGFGHNAVLGVADKVIDAVKAGQIRHFFLVGGCDGAKSAVTTTPSLPRRFLTTA